MLLDLQNSKSIHACRHSATAQRDVASSLFVLTIPLHFCHYACASIIHQDYLDCLYGTQTVLWFNGSLLTASFCQVCASNTSTSLPALLAHLLSVVGLVGNDTLSSLPLLVFQPCSHPSLSLFASLPAIPQGVCTSCAQHTWSCPTLINLLNLFQLMMAHYIKPHVKW